jgi:rhamnogalacturonan hydrolase
VTVKVRTDLSICEQQSNSLQSPSKNILIESIYCNWSGGCAMGSLAADTDISDVTYRNIYTWSSNQMFMVKSNGGSGTVSNLLLENFIGTFPAFPSNSTSS